MVEKGGQFCAKWPRLGRGSSGCRAHYHDTLTFVMVKVRCVLLKSGEPIMCFMCHGQWCACVCVCELSGQVISGIRTLGIEMERVC